MVEMEVVGVALEANSNRPLVWLRDGDQKVFLPIAIGSFEATAIYMELYDEPPPRPITHDLLRSILQGLDAEVAQVVISELREDTFHAQIVLIAEERTVNIDSRPSDAIALALRTGASILVAEQVVREAGLDVEEVGGGTPGLSKAPHEPKEGRRQLDAAEASTLRVSTTATTEQRAGDLRARLQEAVAREDYEVAANLRDEIERLANPDD